MGIDTIDQQGGSTVVDFDAFFGVLDLGMLDPGDGIRLIYEIDARVYTGQAGDSLDGRPGPPTVAGQALIEDPFSLDAGFFLNGQSLASLIAGPGGPTTPGVPGPAAWLLLVCGLAAVAARRRKQR